MFAALFFAFFTAVSYLPGVAPASTASSAAAITDFNLNGSGCPPGTSVAELSSDALSINASFSGFTPSTSSSITTSRRNCQAVVQVAVPAGQQFTVDKVSYSGYVQLQPGAALIHQSTYYFQGHIAQNTASASNQGPIAQTIDLTNSFAGQSQIWSACGADSIVNINIAAVVRSTTVSATSFASIDHATIGPFVFRSC